MGQLVYYSPPWKLKLPTYSWDTLDVPSGLIVAYAVHTLSCMSFACTVTPDL